MLIAGSSFTMRISIGEDITGATVVISMRTPSGATSEWTGDQVTIEDAENGIVSHEIVPAEVANAGVYLVWGTFVFPDSSVWKTPARRFTLYAEGTVEQ